MDMTNLIQPDSTQINADDLIGHEMTVTVESVSAGTAEQPINIGLKETPGRAYRPSKSMRRVLVAAWGPEADNYVGRRMTLYREPSIKFGRDVVGGVRISHLSHIDKPMLIALTVSRGKREAFTVQPLPDSPAPAPSPTEPTLADIQACDSLDDLRAMWRPDLSDKTKALITARKDELEKAGA